MYVHHSQKRDNGTFYVWLEFTDEERRQLLHKCPHVDTIVPHVDQSDKCLTPSECQDPCLTEHWQRNLNCDLIEQHTRTMLKLVQDAIKGHEPTRLLRDWEER